MHCMNCGREVSRGVDRRPHLFCSGRCASEFEDRLQGEETLSENLVDER